MDLITQSLDLENSKPVATPGVKNPDPGLEAEKCSGDDDTGPKDILELFCALTSDSTLKIKKEVKFNEAANSFHNVVAYSKIYGWLPSMKVATSKGWKDVSARACHFTGKSA